MLRSAISGRTVRNIHSHVVDELGRAIVNGTYASGMLLPGDVELVERLKASRTVLREAMKTLAAKGLIVPKARIGTRVTERTKWNFFDADVLRWHLEDRIDGTFMQHLSEMRQSFEPFAARLATENATPDDIARLYAHADAMFKAGAIEDFALADLDFHMALLDASKNPFMYSVGSLIEAALVTSFRLSSPFGKPDRHEEIALLHKRIVEAIDAGDADAAARAVEAVIREGRDGATKAPKRT